MSQIVENEQAKLTANWLNAIAGGTMTAGVVTPLVAYGLGLLGPDTSPLPVGAIASFCLLASLGLHMAGRLILRRLT